jgi:heptosyltransferase-2
MSLSDKINGKPHSLLLFKLGAIGDCIMAVPAAYAMHQAGYQVDWVCSTAIAPVLRMYPWLRVIPMDEAGLLRGTVPQRLAALAGVWKLVARERYSLCATLYYDARYRLLALPVRSGRKLMLSRTDRRTMLLPGRHHTDEYARILLNRADGEDPGQLAPVPVPVQGLPPDPIPSPGGQPRIILVPAGARNALRDDALRRWPVERYVELAGRLLERGFQVVLCGGPDDAWASAAFAALPVIDAIGQLSLPQTLAAMAGASVTVTHDTGPLHLAGVTSTAIVAVFGPTDPRGRLPQRANCTAIWGGEGFACRPCYDGRDYAACGHNGCMHQVTVSMVLQEVELLLAARRDDKPLPPRVVTPPSTYVQVGLPAAPKPVTIPSPNTTGAPA